MQKKNKKWHGEMQKMLEIDLERSIPTWDNAVGGVVKANIEILETEAK